MNKNAISALQEFMQKSCQPVPKYDIIRTNIQTSPIFTYRVDCEYRGRRFSTTGESKSKQAAKHKAAENMIAELKKNNLTIYYISDVDTELSEGNSFCSSPNEINIIGKLQEYCIKNKYAMPTYSEENYSQGHSNFKMTCTVGKYKVDGESNGKKKQAKYVCAKKMFESLQQMTEDQIIEYKIRDTEIRVLPKTGNSQVDGKASNLQSLSIDSPDKTDYVIKKALLLFPKLTKNHTVSGDSTKVKLSLYHTYFRNSLNNVQLKKFFEFYQLLNLQQIQGDIYKLSTALNQICTILNITNEESAVRTEDNKNFAIVIKLTTNPEFSDIGIADNLADARLKVYFRTIRTIFYLLI